MTKYTGKMMWESVSLRRRKELRLETFDALATAGSWQISVQEPGAYSSLRKVVGERRDETGRKESKKNQGRLGEQRVSLSLKSPSS